MINFLGCKEVLDYCAYYIDHETNATEGAVPAGFALPGASVTLVDEAGKAVEQHTVGQIAVGIPSASPGYWRRPDLTNERFRHDSSDDGGRICNDRRSGLPDHGLVYMGRRDSMVKVRGHRVDVTHLEHVLHDLRSVKAAAVVAKTGDRQDLRLVAFIVARPPGRITDRDLRRELAARLPNFMIPSEFLFLEELPTTPMGKIDRQNLRLLAAASQPQTRAARLPRNRIGKDIAAIWAQVLKVDHVGMRDDFFDLGGDSLMVMQVCARIEQQFEIEFPLSMLFKFRTVVGSSRMWRRKWVSPGEPQIRIRLSWVPVHSHAVTRSDRQRPNDRVPQRPRYPGSHRQHPSGRADPARYRPLPPVRQAGKPESGRLDLTGSPCR